MLLADDIILFPFKSILKVFREIYNAAIQELEQEADQIRLQLSELYLSLESGAIDETTFEDRERLLLDRLDVLEADGDDPEDESADEDIEGEDDGSEDEEPEDEGGSPEANVDDDP